MQECIQGFKSLSLRQVRGDFLTTNFSLKNFLPQFYPHFAFPYVAWAIAFCQLSHFEFGAGEFRTCATLQILHSSALAPLRTPTAFHPFADAFAYTHASALYYLLRKSIYKVARAYTAPFYRLFLVLIFYVIVRFLSQ